MTEETLFREALSRPPGERATFLKNACAGRPDLRAAVEQLLVAHGKPENILDRPPAELDPMADSAPNDSAWQATGAYDSTNAAPPAATGDHPATVASGVVIAGRYTLVEKIGEGGMGDVWVARQTDPVKRRVALKLIKAGMDSRAVLQRFEQERQALAVMEHPNIARVIDGGMTAERRPFFVMELVNGLPLTRFCDEARLGIRERLELFASICQAVQHAHQKGIIHRDLKPSNILVTVIDGRPVPKVIDFGVAKAISGRLTDGSLSTQFGAVVGTLEYMSPEQAGFAGEDIDTRSDIYSLGVILYELLTGLRPIDATRLRKAAFTEMIRIIKEEDPSKPSTRLSADASAPSAAVLRQTEPKRLAALLRGELDWVVMKCLDKQRSRRYETANGLARDVQRFLANEVVEARPPSARYLVRKFVSRHRGQVLASGLLLLVLLAGIAGTTWGLIREAKVNAELTRTNAELARSRAAVQARYDLAVDAIKTFHTGVSEDFLLKEEKFKDLRDRLLKAAADFYGKLSSLLGKETDVASRQALAQSSFELAGLTGKVGRTEDALAAHRAVLAVRRALASDPAADSGVKVDVGRSLTSVASLLQSLGKNDEAEATYRKAEAWLVDLARSSSAARAELAVCRTWMGDLLTKTGKTSDALASYRLARADQEAQAAPGASNEARRDLADTIMRISLVLQNTGKYAEAEAESREALALRQRLADDNPAVTEFRSRLADSHHNLGWLLVLSGKQSESEAEYRKALALTETLAHENPAVILHRNSLASVYNVFGLQLMDQGKLSEGQAALRTALTLRQKLADENPTVPNFLSRLANSHNNLGWFLWESGKPSEAVAEYRKAVELYQKLADDDPAVTEFRKNLALGHANLGRTLTGTGEPSEAVAELRAAQALYQKLADDEPLVYAHQNILGDSFWHLGTTFWEIGRPAEAEAQWRKALAIKQKLSGDHPDVAWVRADVAGGHDGLAVKLSQMGRDAEGEAEIRRAIAVGRKPVDDYPANDRFRGRLASNHLHLGILLLRAGRPSEAVAESRMALALYQKAAADQPAASAYRDGVAAALTLHGDVSRSLGRAAPARNDYEQAIALLERLNRETHLKPGSRSSLAFAIRRRGLARRDLGDLAGLSADTRRALELFDGLPSRDAEQWFETACCHAALSGSAGQGGAGVPSTAGDEEATRAIVLLLKAAGMSYRSMSIYRNETALDPLRGRGDFNLLMMDLAIPSEPFTR